MNGFDVRPEQVEELIVEDVERPIVIEVRAP